MFLDFLFWILVLLFTFYVIAIVTDHYFIPSLKEIGKRWKLTEDAAGATLMALGSSAPELFVALTAVLRAGDHVALGAGNIVGSAIFQILVLVGATALVASAKLLWQPVLRDLGLYLAGVILLFYFLSDGRVEWWEALILLILYLFYVFLVIRWKKWLSYEDPIKKRNVSFQSSSRITFPVRWVLNRLLPKNPSRYLLFIVSVILIGALSWLLVESAIQIARSTGVPEVIIALLIIASGNSIPDLLSSIKAAREKMADMAVSNAIGSNNFDVFFGLSFPWLLYLLIYQQGAIPIASEHLFRSATVLIASVIVLFLVLLLNRFRIGPKVGFLLIFLYFIYVGWVIWRASIF